MRKAVIGERFAGGVRTACMDGQEPAARRALPCVAIAAVGHRGVREWASESTRYARHCSSSIAHWPRVSASIGPFGSLESRTSTRSEVRAASTQLSEIFMLRKLLCHGPAELDRGLHPALQPVRTVADASTITGHRPSGLGIASLRYHHRKYIAPQYELRAATQLP